MKKAIFLATLVIASLPAWSQSQAQSSPQLGMQIVGDDHSDFGLMIKQWINQSPGAAFAPGLIDEQIEPLDAQQQKRLRQVRQAMKAK